MTPKPKASKAIDVIQNKDLARVFDIGKHPWSKQSWEPAEPFNAFQVYLALGPERSLMQLSVLLKESKGKAPKTPQKYIPGHIGDWSTQYLWRSRCTAHDVHLSELRFKAYENEIEAMARRQARFFFKLQESAAKGMEALEKAGAYPTKWADITSMLDVGAKAERASLGIVDIPVPAKTSNFNFSNLTSAELEQFIQLHSKLSQHQIGQSTIIDQED